MTTASELQNAAQTGSPPSRGVQESFRLLVENAQLLAVNLVAVEAHVDRSQRAPQEGEPVELKIDRTSRSGFHEGSRVVVGGVKFNLTECCEGAASPIVQILTEYEVVYGIPEHVTDIKAGIDMFVMLNGVFNVWPFFRELVHSLSMRFGYLPIIVPLLHSSLLVPSQGVPPAADEASDNTR